MKYTVTMVLEKETPGAFRYQEVGPDGPKKGDTQGAVIGTLYIRKAAVERPVPDKITVEVTL